MTLVNISNKIINLGSDPILPSETRPITKATAELPSIKAFVEQHLLQIVDEGKTAAPEKKASVKEEAPASTPTTPAAPSANVPVGGDDVKNAPAEDDKKASTTKKK